MAKDSKMGVPMGSIGKKQKLEGHTDRPETSVPGDGYGGAKRSGKAQSLPEHTNQPTTNVSGDGMGGAKG